MASEPSTSSPPDEGKQPSEKVQPFIRFTAWAVLGIAVLSEVYYTYRVRGAWSPLSRLLTGLVDLAVPLFYFVRAKKFSSPRLAAIAAWLIAALHGLGPYEPHETFDSPMSDPRAVLPMADAMFFPLVYQVLTAIESAAQRIRSAFSDGAAMSKKVTAILRPLLVLVGITATFHACTAAPRYASRAHDRIHVGMDAPEVVAIMEEGRGDYLFPMTFHDYRIKALDENSFKECETAKPAYDKCTGGQFMKRFECEKTFPQFNFMSGACTGLRYEPAEFSRRLQGLTASGRKYSAWDVRLAADFHGPMFLNNVFDVDFDQNGKVRSVTEVKHFD